MSTNINVVVDNRQLVAAARELQRQKRLSELNKLRKEFAAKREARKDKNRESGIDSYKKKKETGIRKFGDNAVFGGYLIKDWYRNDSDESTWNAPSLIPTIIESHVKVSCAPPTGENWTTVQACNLTMARPDFTYNSQGSANYLMNNTYGLSSEFYTLAFPVGDGVSIITVICEVQMLVNVIADTAGTVFLYPICWDQSSQIIREIISFRVDQETAVQIETPGYLKSIIEIVAPTPVFQLGYNQEGEPSNFCPTEPYPHPTVPGAFYWPQSFPGGFRSEPNLINDEEFKNIVSYPSAGNNLAAAYTETNDMKWFGPNIFNWLYAPHIPADDFFYSPILDPSYALESDVIVGTYSEVEPNYTFPYFGQTGATSNIIATGNMYDIIGYYGHSIDMRFLWFSPEQRIQAYPNIVGGEDPYSAYLNADLYWSFGYIDHPDTGENQGQAVGAPFWDASINGIQISSGVAYGYTSTPYIYGSFPNNVAEFPCSTVNCSQEFTLEEYDESPTYWALSRNRTLPSHLSAADDFKIEIICVCDIGEDWTQDLIALGFSPDTL